MRSLKITALVICLFAAGTVSAKDKDKEEKYQWKDGRSEGYNYKYVTNDPMQTRFYTLRNGLSVILSPTHQEPRMHVYIAVKAGSKTDPADHTGLAHYLEHMMFKGTENYGSLDWSKEKPMLDKINLLYEAYNHTKDEEKRKEIYHKIDSVSGIAAKFAIANEYDKMMSSIGAKGTNAFTSFEETVYTEDIPSNAVDKFFKVESERFSDPVFRIFHTELEAVYEEKNRTLDNDNRKVSELMLANLFLNHNYGKQTTIGTVEHLKNPSLLEIRKYFDTYYVPNNMGIIVSGDFEPDELIQKIDHYFSKMDSKEVPKYTFKPEAPITTPIVKEVYGPDAEFVAIGYRMPGVHSSKDALMADLVGQILTNGRAGLIDLDLVKKQKLLRASASVDVLVDYGYMNLQGVPTLGQNLDEVKNLMLGEISKLKSGTFDDDLLISIVNNQKKFQMQQVEKYGLRASALMGAFTGEEDWLEDVSYIDRLSKLTKKDIVAFANKYFGENYVVVYKRKGVDKNIVKVEKPPITPVETNRNSQSQFVKTVIDMPVEPVKPLWVDYNKDLKKGELGPAEILYVHNDENGLFRMAYRYKFGIWNNNKIGIAAQYLQFLGTDKMSAEEISKEFYKLACSFSVRADNEYTTISLEGLQENFDKAVSLLEDLIANCKPDEEALAALKARINKSRADAKNNKGAIMQGLISYARYGADNPFKYGSGADLDKITSTELVNMIHNASNRSHRILYYGPETIGTLTASLKSVHKMPDMFTPSPAAKVFTFTSQTQNEVLFADYDMVQSEIRWVRNIPGYDPAKQPAIDMFNNYFGGNMGALVFQTIRESKALAYSTNSMVFTPEKKEDPYYISAYVGCQADKFSESIKAMNELLNDLPSVENNMLAARSGLKKDIETERITKDDIIYNFIAAERKGLNEDIRKSIYENADRLTYSDLKKFHDDNMAVKPFTYCIVASEKKLNADEVQKCGPVRKLSLTEIFGY